MHVSHVRAASCSGVRYIWCLGLILGTSVMLGAVWLTLMLPFPLRVFDTLNANRQLSFCSLLGAASDS